jgi:hypothetical protein
VHIALVKEIAKQPNAMRLAAWIGQRNTK